MLSNVGLSAASAAAGGRPARGPPRQQTLRGPVLAPHALRLRARDPASGPARRPGRQTWLRTPPPPSAQMRTFRVSVSSALQPAGGSGPDSVKVTVQRQGVLQQSGQGSRPGLRPSQTPGPGPGCGPPPQTACSPVPCEEHRQRLVLWAGSGCSRPGGDEKTLGGMRAGSAAGPRAGTRNGRPHLHSAELACSARGEVDGGSRDKNGSGRPRGSTRVAPLLASAPPL